MKYVSTKLYLTCGLFLLFFFVSLPAAVACTTCNRPLQAAIFDESFSKLFLLVVLPFLVIGVAAVRLYKLK